MAIAFTKMHALGNDYVYVNVFDQTIDDPPALARVISDRHRGVGSDGLILIAPPTRGDAHVRMRLFNRDGSEGEMCGNGVRCVGKYAYEHGLARENPVRVETGGGVRVLELTLDADDRVTTVRADMGPAILDPRRIPVLHSGERVVAEPIEVCGEQLSMTCISLGNPHVIIFVRDLHDVLLHEWGPALECHRLFPERVNVHFAQVISRERIDMLIWERGSGPTQGCGSGATAVCAAGVLNDLCDRRVVVRQPGGELQVEWDEDSDHLFMTGPATEVFTGTWPTSPGAAP